MTSVSLPADSHWESTAFSSSNVNVDVSISLSKVTSVSLSTSTSAGSVRSAKSGALCLTASIHDSLKRSAAVLLFQSFKALIVRTIVAMMPIVLKTSNPVIMFSPQENHVGRAQLIQMSKRRVRGQQPWMRLFPWLLDRLQGSGLGPPICLGLPSLAARF